MSEATLDGAWVGGVVDNIDLEKSEGSYSQRGMG